MTPLDQVIDHGAKLQQQIDALERELTVYYLSLLALSFVVGFLTFQVWQASRG